MANSIKEVNRNYATGQKDFAGLSADVSQLPKKADGTVTGSIFYAIDTQQVYMFEATTDQWILSSEGGTGGSGGNAGGGSNMKVVKIALGVDLETMNFTVESDTTPKEIYESFEDGIRFLITFDGSEYGINEAGMFDGFSVMASYRSSKNMFTAGCATYGFGSLAIIEGRQNENTNTIEWEFVPSE